ncbi:hypothetical protein HHK36_017686 [Tetracentron sinense]|uniref:non-specific serine/threonine protein kinase n=1 Tax=Tetracentron sinense TaxID=13715 RepID=A0A834YUQ1_TETSI|nr:hypothetical protein HHK36_017686 [Tetracentron sinense]
MLVEHEEAALDDMRRLEKLVVIAFWCIQEDPSLRPTMKKVTQMLEGAVEVSVPPDPSSFISSIMKEIMIKAFFSVDPGIYNEEPAFDSREFFDKGLHKTDLSMASVLSLLLPFLLLLPISTIAQTYRNVSLGSSLSALNNNNSFWASPSGDFAFGFRQIGSSGFLLAIWFNKITDKTVVWSANRDKLVGRGSKVELSTDGRLVLNDPQGREIWKAEPMDTGVTYAAMLDTGNLVLANKDSVNLWESFNEPTDTILPTQIWELGTRLLSRQSEVDYSRGRFQFSLQTDGNLVLYTMPPLADAVYFAYWASNTVGRGSQLVFNQSGYIYLVERNGTLFEISSTNNTSPTRNLYQRVVLDYDGVLRQYVYPKTSSSRDGRWPQSWSTVWDMPGDSCMRITGGTTSGSGACGFNSYCELGEDQRPICKCPPGYTSLDPGNRMKGCKQNFVSQSCDEGVQESALFEMRQMPNTDWTLSDFEKYASVTEDWCRNVCLNDCFCDVAIFRDDSCSMKKLPLSNGRIDSRIGGKALIKIRRDNSSSQPTGRSTPKKDHYTLKVLGPLLGSSVFLNFLLLLAAALYFFKPFHKRSQTLQPYPVMSGINLRSFTYKELEEATNGFKEELGVGAFATVYKGTLAMEDGNAIAVKKLEMMERDCELEFKTEVGTIGRTNHKNLVQLLGFCDDGQHRLLDENKTILTDWAYDCYRAGRLDMLVEHEEAALDDMRRLEKLVVIAFWCIQEDPSIRPTMKKVTQMLEGAVEVSVPPDPSSFISLHKTDLSMASVLSLLLPFLLLLPISTIAQTYRNVSLGSSLSALNNNNTFWASPSGDFAFGFRQIGSSGFLLAIWFNKITDKTVVWSANQDKLVGRGSKVELSTDGRLVLNDPQGREIWKAEPMDTGVTYAAMLDTGNLVLANKDSVNLWGSFEEPTDTILPTQILEQGNRLISRQSQMDYSRGRFQFKLQTDGNLVLYTTAFPTDNVYFAYWSSNTVGTDSQLVFNQSGYIYLRQSNGSLVEVTSANNTSSTINFYQRAILDSDGVFRLYVYPKSSGLSTDGRWPESWSTVASIPSNICLRITGDFGSGACGFNSYCELGEEDQRPICKCPYGYTYLDPSNRMKGCKQNFVSQSCDEGVQESDLFEMRQMPNTDWPLDERCWKKKLPLSNGRIDSSVGGKALIKIRRENSSSQSTCTIPKKDRYTLKVLGPLLGSSVFLNFLLLLAAALFFFYPYNKRSQTLQQYPVMSGINLRSFTYKELEEATNGFKEKLGDGAFATVYKGTLAMEDGNFFAVKKLEKMEREGEQEFKTEVRAIGRTNHKNLVQLLGFCDEGQHRLLDENKVILTDWAYDCYRAGRLDMLVENEEEALDDSRRLEKLVMIALWCIQEDPSLRPTMKKVTQMLEGAVEVSIPPDPSSFISSIV